MSTHQQAVLLREADDGVGVVERELAPGSLGRIPLHAVLGSELAKERLDHFGILRAAEKARVGNGAVILLALGDEELVDAGGATGGATAAVAVSDVVASLDAGGRCDQRSGKEEQLLHHHLVETERVMYQPTLKSNE